MRNYVYYPKMDRVIRPIDPDTAQSASVESGISIWLWVLISLLGLIILGSMIFAGLSANALGWNSLIFFAALGVVSFLTIIGLFTVFRQTKHVSDAGGTFQEVFENNLAPLLVTEMGKPVQANKAYLEFAQSLNIDPIGDVPPAIERLFKAKGDAVASAIFRLHHISDKSVEAEEVIDYPIPNGDIHKFRLSVRRMPSASQKFLWQITDVTSQNTFADKMISAPVGLFSVSQSGKILAMNSVLLGWLGQDENPRPEMMKEFIEKPDSLLQSQAIAGRTIKTDAVLITRKGVKTPSVMVGTWQSVGQEELICNVALYGHSYKDAPPFTIKPSQPGSGAETRSLTSSQLAGFSAAPVGMIELHLPDAETPLSSAKIVSANPAFERMGRGLDITDKTFAHIFKAQEGENRFLALKPHQCNPDKPFDGSLAGDPSLPVSIYILSAAGQVADIANLGMDSQGQDEITIWAYLVDVSARKSLEDQLVQSQKMQAIGQLAAGVAHDFNNLLTAIRLNTDELLQRHPVGDPSYPELQNINATGARAGSLVKKLLAFSRKQTRRTEMLSVTDTLSDMVVTLRQTLGEKAKLVMVHGRNLPPVIADKSQIDTVLMNLCVNARDAMAEQGGGTITVKSGVFTRDQITEAALAEALQNIPGDEFVTIEVSDTGTGMSDEVKAKIFEPFFTTKEAGKGTGLGLATVYGIVQHTGGHLDVKSKLGEGTTFRITLPAADPAAVKAKVEADKAAPVAEARKPSDLAGQGTILFVEDEASVRIIAAKSMRKRGYTVIEAEDGEEALEILEDGEHVFDMMISDVVMPGMDGPTLLKEGRPLLGDARIVFISGYAEEQFSDLLSEEPDVTFLPKPFTLAQLAEKVKAEIGEAQ